MTKERPIGRCPRCGIEVVRDLVGRCVDPQCPPLEPIRPAPSAPDMLVH